MDTLVHSYKERKDFGYLFERNGVRAGRQDTGQKQSGFALQVSMGFLIRSQVNKERAQRKKVNVWQQYSL
jgi:hypothetical protein